MAELKDHGPNPLVTNIEGDTVANNNYRSTLWTGKYFQITLMSIPVGGEIGLEIHNGTDQFLRIEQGRGRVQMGPAQDQLTFDTEAAEDFAIIVPDNTWHNVTNIGDTPLKVYSIYAPPHHPFDTVHPTKADSDAAEAAEHAAEA
jgi:mannose-6-phosphate isomerase-like protein (cupin superfamily)